MTPALLPLVVILLSGESLAAGVLLPPAPSFKGKIAPSVKDSVPAWPQSPKAPTGAPNIVIVLLDDVGFADTSTFGGVAQTPQLDKLAAQGLRYINFNTTGTCSPTRAALLTGRNHHRVGFGFAEIAAGFPGYDFLWKKDTISVAEVLRRNGYSTAAFGKWHNTPRWEISPAGPFDRWPTHLGFEYFYGFMAGMDNQWEPSYLFRNTTPVEPGKTPEQRYHFTTDITDEAVGWLHTHQALACQKPYFLYFAPGAVHFPHHAPKEWIDRYRGRFDEGWDRLRQETFARQKQLKVIPTSAELTPRPKEIPAWESLSVEQKRLYARQMGVYAGFIAHTDHEVGRLPDVVRQSPGADNTLILYIVSDNGASADGGVGGFTNGAASRSVADQLAYFDEMSSPRDAWSHYSAGWAWAGSTPFQWWKGMPSHFGGARAPLVAVWPAKIKARGVRAQFTHVNDVAATVYEVTGVRFPSTVDGIEQQPLDGVSFVHTFEDPNALSRHHTQYFEMSGNRAIYHDGWVAAARHGAWIGISSFGFDFTRDKWELYRVEKDFSQAQDIAAPYPAKLAQLQELFDTEARKNHVYPLGAALSGLLAGSTRPPNDERREVTYYPGTPRLPGEALPGISGRSYRIAARAILPESAAQGVILSYGGRESGFVLYLKEGRLVYENHPGVGLREIVASDIVLPHGPVDLVFEFTADAANKGRSGNGRLLIDGQVARQGRLTEPFGGSAYSQSLGIGRAFGSPVSEAFQPPFEFTGTLVDVNVQLK